MRLAVADAGRARRASTSRRSGSQRLPEDESGVVRLGTRTGKAIVELVAGAGRLPAARAGRAASSTSRSLSRSERSWRQPLLRASPSAGWRLTGASDHLVSEALYLDDPEGNGIEIYRDRPREEWPMARRAQIQMDTLPLDLDSSSVSSGRRGRRPLPRERGSATST